MGLRFNWRPKFGPFRLHFGKRGYSSTTTKLGRWSWNSRARRHRVDLPGPWSWVGRRKSR